jgi:hypothetical protein
VLDRLQGIDEHLPLRVVPLRIRKTPAMESRSGPAIADADEAQRRASACWDDELHRRFTRDELRVPVNRVRIAHR